MKQIFFFLTFPVSLAIFCENAEIAKGFASHKLAYRQSIPPEYTNILINPKIGTTA